MKYAIYMVAIDDPSTKVRNSDYAQYGIASWKHWCEKNGVDFILITESGLSDSKPIWNKSLIHRYEGIQQYDKIGIVDSDTIINPNAPNIFKEIDEGFYGVNDICDINWLMSSIEDRQRFFPNVKLDIFKYLNTGVLFFDKSQIFVFRYLLAFYYKNKKEIDSIKGGGIEQTLLNFMLKQEEVKINLLSPAWNLLSIHRKNMMTNNWQLHPEFQGQAHYKYPKESYPHFMKYSHIMHFTGFPIEDRTYYMSVTWDLLKQFT